MFLGKKTLILLDQEFLYNHILNFFKYITQNSFDFDLRIISEIDYRENKNEFEDFLIFRNRKVIKDNGRERVIIT